MRAIIWGPPSSRRRFQQAATNLCPNNGMSAAGLRLVHALQDPATPAAYLSQVDGDVDSEPRRTDLDAGAGVAGLAGALLRVCAGVAAAGDGGGARAAPLGARVAGGNLKLKLRKLRRKRASKLNNQGGLLARTSCEERRPRSSNEILAGKRSRVSELGACFKAGGALVSIGHSFRLGTLHIGAVSPGPLGRPSPGG